MSTEMDPQALPRYLSMRLMQVPALHEILEQVVPKDYPAPRCQVFITRPNDPNALQVYYSVGAKVSYIDKDGLVQQFGQLFRINSIQSKTLLEHGIEVLGHSLAQGIRAHETPQPLLPVLPLTAKDREELCLLF